MLKKPTDLLIFFTHYIPFSSFIFFKNSLQWETIKHAFGVTTEVMKVCIPEMKDQNVVGQQEVMFLFG